MNADDAAVFVAVYKTCADPLPVAGDCSDASSPVEAAQPGTPTPEAAVAARAAALGVSMRAAWALLECLPTVALGRMALVNRAWQGLVRQQLASSPMRRDSVYAARLNAAVAARAVAVAAKLLLEAPNALSNHQAVTESNGSSSANLTAAREASQAIAAARAAQRAWALEDQALTFVAAAVAGGAADAAAGAALDEAMALGLGEHASVCALQEILNPKKGNYAAGVVGARGSGGAASAASAASAAESTTAHSSRINEYEMSFGPGRLGFGIAVGSPAAHRGLPVVSKGGSFPFPAQGHVLLYASLTSKSGTAGSGDASGGDSQKSILWPIHGSTSFPSSSATSMGKKMAAASSITSNHLNQGPALEDCEELYDARVEVLANLSLRPLSLRFLATDGLVPPPKPPPPKLATFTAESSLSIAHPPAVPDRAADRADAATPSTTVAPKANSLGAPASDKPAQPVSKLAAFMQSAPSSSSPAKPKPEVSKLSAFMTSVTPS